MQKARRDIQDATHMTELLLSFGQFLNQNQVWLTVDLSLSSRESGPYLPRPMADIGNLDQIIRDDPVNDAIIISCSQKRPITLERIEHTRAYLGQLPQELQFGNNLILDRQGKGLEFSLSPTKKLNLSWHVWPFWL
jgi:hypothetical protein